MINVLYIHGLGSSSSSSTGRMLASLDSDEITFFHPTFSVSPTKAMREINNFIDEHKIDLVIGSSLGGFYALMSKCKYGVVINPALTPISDIGNAIGYGEHDMVNGEGTYVIDEAFMNELESIIRSNYGDIDLGYWFKDFPKDRIFAGLFGNKDAYFAHYDDFHLINSAYVTLLGFMAHRMTKEAMPILLAMITEILKISKGISVDLRLNQTD